MIDKFGDYVFVGDWLVWVSKIWRSELRKGPVVRFIGDIAEVELGTHYELVTIRDACLLRTQVIEREWNENW